MTDNEFKEEFLKLINKLPENRNIFLMVYNNDDNELDVKMMGLGCKACAFEILVELFLKNPFPHNREIH